MEEQGNLYTLDEALGSVGFAKFQALVLAYAGLGCMAEAMEVMILSFLGTSITSEWGLSAAQESIIATVVFAGTLIGNYLWGLISDTFGRRKGFLGIAIVTGGAGFLSTFSPNYISLIVLMFLLGIGLGGGPVYISWFLEFVPAQKRGTWMVALNTFWAIGTILEAALAMLVMPRRGWRWLLVLSSIPSFVALVFYALVPESPRYLMTKGKRGDAHDVLEKVALINGAELPSGMLITCKMLETDEEPVVEDMHLLSSTGCRTEASSKTRLASVFVLFLPKLIRATLLMWMVFFGYAFSYYGIILMASSLRSGQSECSAAVLHTEKSKDTSLYIGVFITTLSELPALVFAAVVVDKIGRKLSMGTMFTLAFVFLLPLVFQQQHMITTGLLFGARMSISATFTVANVYTPEIYPTKVRTTGLGVASAVGSIGGMICPLAAVGLVTNCHQTEAVVLFEVVLVLSAVSVMLLPFETKGRQLADTVAASNPLEITLIK